MIKIYQGGSTGLVQQNRRMIMKPSRNKGEVGIQRQLKDMLKAKFSFDIVIMHFGNFFRIIEEDAEFFNKEFNFKLSQPGRFSFVTTAFPLNVRQKYIEKLKGMNKEFCLLDQYQVDDKEEFYRKVNVSTNKDALGFWY
jgi:DNA mismatch repair ATPase MutS